MFLVEIRNYKSGDGDYPEADARMIANILDNYLDRSDSEGTVIVEPYIPTIESKPPHAD